MKHFFLLLLLLRCACLFSTVSIPADDRHTDSLQRLLRTTSNDTIRVQLQFGLAFARPPADVASWEYLRQQAETHGMYVHEIKALNMMSKLYADSGNFDNATEALARALTIAERHEDPGFIIEQIKRLHSLYGGKSDRKKSLYYIIEGLKAAERFNDREALTFFYSTLAVYYFYAGDPQKALKMHFLSLKRARELNYNIGIIGALLDIGSAYSSMDQPDKAAVYFLESKRYVHTVQGSIHLSEIYTAIGAGHRFRKKYDSAEYYARKAYNTARDMKLISPMASALVSMGWLECERGNMAAAGRCAREALILVKQSNFIAQLPALYDLQTKIYTKTGNYQKALESYELYTRIRDSISDEETRRLGMEKEFEFDLEKKESRNKLLTQQNEIQELELQRTKYIGAGAGIIAVIVLLAGLMFMRHRRYKNDHQRVQLEQKLLRSQMNPHFVFNSLNSIQQLIMEGKNAPAELYLFKFATLMRDLLESNIKDTITVEEETGMLKAYLEMEALRFGSRFSYAVTTDKRILQQHTPIPHLMIQPFVENAIWHGLLPKPGNRQLDISIQYDTAKTIRCIVEDNGIGREASATRESTFRKKSLALSFVKQRIELIRKTYRIQGSITITDKKDEAGNSKGTLVEIVLPILNA